MSENIHVRCDGCSTIMTVTVTATPRLSAKTRAARIDAALAGEGWLPGPDTDFCPDCLGKPPTDPSTPPPLRVVR